MRWMLFDRVATSIQKSNKFKLDEDLKGFFAPHSQTLTTRLKAVRRRGADLTADVLGSTEPQSRLRCSSYEDPLQRCQTRHWGRICREERQTRPFRWRKERIHPLVHRFSHSKILLRIDYWRFTAPERSKRRISYFSSASDPLPNFPNTPSRSTSTSHA